MKTLKIIFALFILGTTLSNIGAQSMNMNKDATMSPAENKVSKAVCVVYPTKDNMVTGTITYMKVDGGVKVIADLQGLTPGKHGMHIHECGDCSSENGSSAGGHFNPMSKTHGAPMGTERHEGDMGNIEADNNGKAHLEYVDKMISFEGPYSIIGRSVIVHKDADDFKTQPTGNSGARVGCGVIGIGK